MAASRLKVELEELQQQLAALVEESEEARQQRAARRQAAIDRYQAIGDSIGRRAKQVTPLVLLAAVALGIVVGRHLIKNKGE
jgi:hypothetical protein